MFKQKLPTTETQKFCSLGQHWVDKTEFYIKTDSKSGRTRLSYSCKPCSCQYKTNVYRKATKKGKKMGESHHLAKLNNEIVGYINELHNKTIPITNITTILELEKGIKVIPSTVSAVINGKSWKHLRK
jgi:hypothetical protein